MTKSFFIWLLIFLFTLMICALFPLAAFLLNVAPVWLLVDQGEYVTIPLFIFGVFCVITIMALLKKLADIMERR